MCTLLLLTIFGTHLIQLSFKTRFKGTNHAHPFPVIFILPFGVIVSNSRIKIAGQIKITSRNAIANLTEQVSIKVGVWKCKFRMCQLK
jgi:hypothetical protein